MSETSPAKATDFVEATLMTVADPNRFMRLIMYAIAALVVGLYSGYVPAPGVANTDVKAQVQTLEATVAALRSDVKAVAELVAVPDGDAASAPVTKADLDEMRATLAAINSRFDSMTKAKAAESPPKRK